MAQGVSCERENRLGKMDKEKVEVFFFMNQTTIYVSRESRDKTPCSLCMALS